MLVREEVRLGETPGVPGLREQLAVPMERLRWRCDPATLPFESTEEVEPLQGTVGQERAVSALEFGVAIGDGGFNVFIAGQPGSGRTTTARGYLERAAGSQPVPDDWVYVYSFADPYRPKAIRLPAGKGSELSRHMDSLIEAARREIPKALESEDHERRRNDVMSQLQQRQQAMYAELQKEARDHGFALQATTTGIATIPLVDGHPVSAEEYEQLPLETREELQRKGEQFQGRIEQELREGRKLGKEVAERLRQLEREVALFAVGHLFDDVREQYQRHPSVLEYLAQAQEDILAHLGDFQPQQTAAPSGLAELGATSAEDRLGRHRVNVFVDNSQMRGAPVVEEPNPTYYNLMGRLEYQARFGAMATDFRQLKAGALHRANGGYLLLDALDLMSSPLAWDALKKALQTKEVRIENIGEQLSAVPAAALRPEPIPLQCKVALVGSPQVYYSLYHMDEDFRKLFKVKADFGPEMERSEQHILRYASFTSRQVRERGLRHFHKGGVAKAVEYGARLVENQGKLTTRLADIADMLVEASFWAGKNGHSLVMAEDVEEAIGHREYRCDLPKETSQEYIRNGTIMIDTEGEKVGQINGLSVMDLADYSFGVPSRITATTHLGSEGLVHIDREAKLSGPLHSKGVLILSGYMAGKYAHDYPLALSATLTFEQTYGGVDGDSASSTELYTLLSALSGLPIKQGIAVTGSVNQRGEVQAVGGVTRKVEGFFDVCLAKGLTGEQGVIIPETNVGNLMLKDEVVQAVRQGRFRLWSVRTIDEGIELLTGVPAGEQQSDGSYPPGTVHQRVDSRLRESSRQLKEYGTGPRERSRGQREAASKAAPEKTTRT